MERKTTKTIDLKGKNYAEVKERIKEFRTDCARGSIKPTPEFMPDGQIHFTAYILKDKADETSADATGHSFGYNKGEKAFEKLETIAVGRALAFLGYAADGEIASSEEMEEFEEYQVEKQMEEMLLMKERLEDCKTEEELKAAWLTLSAEGKSEFNELKDELKLKLTRIKVAKKVVVKAPEVPTVTEPNHENA